MGMSGGEWAGLVLGGLPGMAIASGMRGQKEQKKALREQAAAQRAAESAAQRQLRENAEELARRNRRQPDFGSLLTQERARARKGLGSTMLTGPGGVDPGQLTLGGPSLLGG